MSISRLSAAERHDLSLRAEDARARAREAAGRCAQNLAYAERHIAEALRVREESRVIRAALEEAVHMYARALRRLEVPPERTLVLVKDAVRAELQTVDRDTRLLMEDVARWCIKAYYAA
ncbi:MAG TPA: hypothetical protein VM076_25940 [Gemmatimonadaceae bacterium]|nr:hypothetical protein [Gemmatimonadaceae bacterium]